MPPVLVRAHAALDEAVNLCYRLAAIATGLSRPEFLCAAHRAWQVYLLSPLAKVGKGVKT